MLSQLKKHFHLATYCLSLLLISLGSASFSQGTLYAHGGGIVFTHGNPPKLYSAFSQPMKEAGRKANIVTIYSHEHDRDKSLAELLLKARYRNVEHLDVKDPEAAQKILRADLIYFDGGVQTRLMKKLNANPKILNAIKQAHNSGTTIAGISAGAAVLSSTMICCDRSGKAIESKGLGLLSSVVIDQHYSQRDREFRLRQIISKHRDKIGVGIDEGVSVRFKGNKLTVLGDKSKRKKATSNFTGCKKVDGIYTCTFKNSFGACDGRKEGEIFYAHGNKIKRTCVKKMTYGKSASRSATIVRFLNGKILEERLEIGQSVSF